MNLTVGGDPNQDDNSYNDRLPGVSRNSYLGPDYTSMDLRLTRRLYVKNRLKADLIVESFNLLNHNNKLVDITQNGLQTQSAYFVKMDTALGLNYYPGHYQIPASPFQATNSYPPRQVQLALRLNF